MLKGLLTGISAQQLQEARTWGNKASLLGDSNSDVELTAATYRYRHIIGPITQLRSRLGGRLILPHTRNYAVSGSTFTSNIANGNLTLAANDDSDFVLVFLGINDINSSRSYAEIIGDIDTYVSTLRAVRKPMAFLGIHPTTTGSTGPTAVERKVGYQVNTYLRNLAQDSPDIVFADPTPYIVDSTSSIGAPASGMLRDEVHYSTKGSSWASYAMAQVLDPLLPPTTLFSFNPEDLYHSTENPTGNYLANPMLSGTSGTVIGGIGVTGSAPDNWIFSGSGTVGSAAVTYTTVSRSPHAGNWVQGVFSGTPGGSTYQYRVNQNLTVAEGTEVQGFFEFEIDEGHSNLEAVWLSLFDAGTGTFTNADLVPTTGYAMDSAAFAGVGITPPLTKRGGSTTMQFLMNFQFTGGVVADATVRVGSPMLHVL